jgi:hypothetical protein
MLLAKGYHRVVIRARAVQVPVERLALVTALAVLAVAVPAVAAAAGTTFLKASVPAGQSVRDLRNQWFVQKLSCSRTCDATTIVSIALRDARKLGFKGPAAPWVRVASSYVRLKPGTPTKVAFVVSSQGKALLPKAKGSLRIVGRITAFATADRTLQDNAGWSAVLR